MVVVIDYGLGNLGSILNMLKKIGAEVVISSNPAVILEADKLILPGVGAFDQGMKNLRQSGLQNVLEQKVIGEKTPILGICLGMQLFAKASEEGVEPGLGWLDCKFVRFSFEDDKHKRFKIPHMGWNYIRRKQLDNPLLADLTEKTRFYFVHSYHAVCENEEDIMTVTDYGYCFTSAVAKGNIWGVQFHPEKSHRFGMQLLKNFMERC